MIDFGDGGFDGGDECRGRAGGDAHFEVVEASGLAFWLMAR